jgi:hypothetical protein
VVQGIVEGICELYVCDQKNERGPEEDLKLQFEAVLRLDPEEKKVIRSVIESIILRHEARRWSNQVEAK